MHVPVAYSVAMHACVDTGHQQCMMPDCAMQDSLDVTISCRRQKLILALALGSFQLESSNTT